MYNKTIDLSNSEVNHHQYNLEESERRQRRVSHVTMNIQIDAFDNHDLFQY